MEPCLPLATATEPIPYSSRDEPTWSVRASQTPALPNAPSFTPSHSRASNNSGAQAASGLCLCEVCAFALSATDARDDAAEARTLARQTEVLRRRSDAFLAHVRSYKLFLQLVASRVHASLVRHALGNENTAAHVHTETTATAATCTQHDSTAAAAASASDIYTRVNPIYTHATSNQTRNDMCDVEGYACTANGMANNTCVHHSPELSHHTSRPSQLTNEPSTTTAMECCTRADPFITPPPSLVGVVAPIQTKVTTAESEDWLRCEQDDDCLPFTATHKEASRCTTSVHHPQCPTDLPETIHETVMCAAHVSKWWCHEVALARLPAGVQVKVLSRVRNVVAEVLRMDACGIALSAEASAMISCAEANGRAGGIVVAAAETTQPPLCGQEDEGCLGHDVCGEGGKEVLLLPVVQAKHVTRMTCEERQLFEAEMQRFAQVLRLVDYSEGVTAADADVDAVSLVRLPSHVCGTRCENGHDEESCCGCVHRRHHTPCRGDQDVCVQDKTQESTVMCTLSTRSSFPHLPAHPPPLWTAGQEGVTAKAMDVIDAGRDDANCSCHRRRGASKDNEERRNYTCTAAVYTDTPNNGGVSLGSACHGVAVVMEAGLVRGSVMETCRECAEVSVTRPGWYDHWNCMHEQSLRLADAYAAASAQKSMLFAHIIASAWVRSLE